LEEKMATKKTGKKKYTKGMEYVCGVCGLEVKINNPCDCEDCNIVCCGQVMKPKKKKK